MGVEVAAHGAGDAVAQPQALAHHLAPQVEVAVAQAHLLADLLVELERQGLGAVQDLQLTRQKLHLPRGKVGIDGAGGPRAHAPRHPDHELVAQPLGLLEHLRQVRVEHHLQQPLAIAHVDEDDPAMVAPPVHPAGHRDVLAEELLVNLSAVM